MSRFDERPPEEIAAWLEESQIAMDLYEHLVERQGTHAAQVLTATRDGRPQDAIAHVGAYDAFAKLKYLLERKPETKR